MAQDIVTQVCGEAESKRLDAMLDTFESDLDDSGVLSYAQKATLLTLCSVSATFCQKVFQKIDLDPEQRPPDFDLEDLFHDIATLTLFAPRILRLWDLIERAVDADRAFDRDVAGDAGEGSGTDGALDPGAGDDHPEPGLHRDGRRKTVRLN